MQAATIQRRIDSLSTLSRSDKRINGLHRLLRSPYHFERAFDRISRNKGIARQSGWERHVNQDENWRPGGMIVAGWRIGKSFLAKAN